jgi:hypothetical protein
LRIAPEALELDPAVLGARTLATPAALLHGPVLKGSEGSYLTSVLEGRPVWEWSGHPGMIGLVTSAPMR